MKITSLLMCKRVEEKEGGRFDLFGVGINRITVSQLPSTFNYTLFAYIAPEEQDSSGMKRSTVALMGEDEALKSWNTEYSIINGQPAKDITNAVFSLSKPGPYRFSLSLEGYDAVASWPFEVLLDR